MTSDSLTSGRLAENKRILALDTSLGACSAALMADGRVVARSFEVLGRGHAERLVPMVQELMAKVGAGFEDLDLIAVTIGPGTFTGVRIGLAAARGFALAHGLPLAGVTSLEAVAAAVYTAPEHDSMPVRLMVIHDARRGEVYTQLFNRPDAPGALPVAMGAPDVVAIDAAPDLPGERPLAVAGTGLPLVADAIARVRPDVVLIDDPRYPEAAVVARVAHRRGPADGPVRPLYLRAPDAKLPSEHSA